MKKQAFVSVYLDSRRPKKNGKFPVKLRVFTPTPRKQKFYPTKYDLTEAEYKTLLEFSQTMKGAKRRNEPAEIREIRMALQAIEAEADRIAESLSVFTFEKFETLMYGETQGAADSLEIAYLKTIDSLKRNNSFSTASTYELSLKALKDFHGKKQFTFFDISPKWLHDFETYMTGEREVSRTTISIYLRALRAVFNNAIAEKTIPAEIYPFGKRKYAIPTPKGVKKALSKEQLKTLFDAAPATPEQERAKAFWFFSYSCNGMNFKDIANLKFKDISGGTMTFQRAKTIRTNNSQAPVKVYLTEFALRVIEKYGNTEREPGNHVFPIYEGAATAGEKHTKLKNFVRYINQHFLKLAKAAGIDEKVSTYWARHSFATNAIRSGASMEFVSEALSHSNLTTTRSYFAGFEDERKKELAEKLMNF